MDDKAMVICVGVICVTILLGLALYMGVDGTLLATGIGAICTIIGIFFGGKLEAKKTTTDVKEP